MSVSCIRLSRPTNHPIGKLAHFSRSRNDCVAKYLDRYRIAKNADTVSVLFPVERSDHTVSRERNMAGNGEIMAQSSTAGAIDVDFHPPSPRITELVPHLDPYWAEQVVARNIDRAPFSLNAYPPNAPISCREEWRPQDGCDPGFILREGLDNFGTGLAIANMLHGVAALHNPDMGSALCAAVNDHLRQAWLDRDSRLRGSILVSVEDPALAAEEIDRMAKDPRMVQVLLFAMLEAPHGNRRYWPIYRAAERHSLTIAIHAGSLYRHAPAVSGWPSFQLEDYVLQSMAFENIVLSLLSEGVFQEFPQLNFVFLESGFAWLPTTLWRIDKTWRGVRAEVPWLDRKPSQVLEDRLFLSLQPVDMPDRQALAMTIRHIGGTGKLLYSTDFPHRQFNGTDALPEGISGEDRRAIPTGNALRAYPRLAADATAIALAGMKEAAT
jgi:uncharacterized protein